MSFKELFTKALVQWKAILKHKIDEYRTDCLELTIIKKLPDCYLLALTKMYHAYSYRGEYSEERMDNVFYYPEEDALKVVQDFPGHTPATIELARFLIEFFPTMPRICFYGTDEYIQETRACTRCENPASDSICALCQAKDEFKINPLPDHPKCKECFYEAPVKQECFDHKALFKGFCLGCLTA